MKQQHDRFYSIVYRKCNRKCSLPSSHKKTSRSCWLSFSSSVAAFYFSTNLFFCTISKYDCAIADKVFQFSTCVKCYTLIFRPTSNSFNMKMNTVCWELAISYSFAHKNLKQSTVILNIWITRLLHWIVGFCAKPGLFGLILPQSSINHIFPFILARFTKKSV